MDDNLDGNEAAQAVEQENDATANQPILVVHSDHDRYAMQRDHAVVRINAIVETIDAYSNNVISLETRKEMLKECYKNFDSKRSCLVRESHCNEKNGYFGTSGKRPCASSIS